jgi:hypothetical protein
MPLMVAVAGQAVNLSWQLADGCVVQQTLMLNFEPTYPALVLPDFDVMTADPLCCTLDRRAIVWAIETDRWPHEPCV